MVLFSNIGESVCDSSCLLCIKICVSLFLPFLVCSEYWLFPAIFFLPCPESSLGNERATIFDDFETKSMKQSLNIDY